ncbi:MAG: ABC transporter ATP-binding protein [Myxococcota bacterium]
MRRLLKYARPYRGRIFWGAFLLLLTNVASMLIPQLIRFAVDGFSSASPGAQLLQVAWTLVVVTAGGAIFRTLSRIHLFYVARDIELDIRIEYYKKLSHQTPDFFELYRTGDLMSRATNDLGEIRLLYGPGLLNVVNTIVAYAVGVPLMWAISPSLTAITMAIYPPGLLMVQRLSRRLYQTNRRQQEEMGRVSNFVQENLAGAHVVRAFAMQDQQDRRFSTIVSDYYSAAVRLAWVRSYLWRLFSALAAAGVLLCVYFGSRAVMEKTISLGEFVALIEYLALLAWPSFALGWILSLWQRGAAAMSRISQIVETQPNLPTTGRKVARHDPSIVVKHLTVGYGGQPALKGVDFTLRAGTTLGVVGPIGSGKTTLLRALVRQIAVPAGQIYIAGDDITEISLDALRTLFGFVHQTPLLFSKTIAENVAFGRPDAPRERITQALREAAFDTELNVFPMGIDTPVGERGITLSGGQKQRCAIARALLFEAPILLLDDALSAVDAETETRILDGLRELRRHRSTVIVAHRVSAVQHADEILVLDRGTIVEQGDHQQLMANGGFYAQMVRRQELEQDLNATPMVSA